MLGVSDGAGVPGGVFGRFGPVQQGLAAQPGADSAGFVDSLRCGLVVTITQQVLGVVEQAVGEVVGGSVLAQAGYGRGERGPGGGLVIVLAGQAGTGQVALGAQQRDNVARLIGVEQGQQFLGGGRVAHLMGGADGERPCPDQLSMAYPEGVGVREDRASAPQRLLWPAVGDGGEGLSEAERRMVLRRFAGAQLPQARQDLIGCRGIAA